jgi:hypothetical protein
MAAEFEENSFETTADVADENAEKLQSKDCQESRNNHTFSSKRSENLKEICG